MELGNIMFNPNKNQIYECPEYVVNCLKNIRYLLDKHMEETDADYENPFGNTGNKFRNEVFEVEAYNWNDDIYQPYNFKCGDIEISWYKYLGRDTTINGQYSVQEIHKMYNKCINSLCNKNKSYF